MVPSLPFLDAGYRAWGRCTMASTWWLDLLPIGCNWAEPKEATWDPLPVGLTPTGGAKGVRLQKFWVAAEPWPSVPWVQKLTLGMWMSPIWWGRSWSWCSRLSGFRLDIVGLTSARGKGSGTSLLWVGLSSTLELQTVRGGGQGWQFLLPPGSVPVHCSLPRWTRG